MNNVIKEFEKLLIKRAVKPQDKVIQVKRISNTQLTKLLSLGYIVIIK